MRIPPRLVLATMFPMAVCGLASAWAHAAGPETPIAVLGIEAIEGAPDSVAATVTEALRQRATFSKGFRLVAGRDLVEVKLVFSCPDEAPSCMVQAAKSLGAAKLIFGSVKKIGTDNYSVKLKILDAARSMVDNFSGDSISTAQATGPGLRGPVQKWFADLTGQGAMGTLRVSGDVIGASVTLDGVPAGLVGSDDLSLAGVPVGKHEIRMTKPGYAPQSKDVTVLNGEIAQLTFSMGPGPAEGASSAGARIDSHSETAGAKDSANEPSALKAATWGILGGGVLGAILAVKFGLDVRTTNKNLDAYRRYTCSSGAGLCDSADLPAKGLTAPELAYVQEEKAQGEKFQTYQYIAIGTSAALLVASGVLLYTGYFQEETGSHHAAVPKVQLAPAVYSDGAGVLAGIRF